MEIIFFLLSIICVTCAHIVKVLRLTQFIEIYEKPDYKSLFQAFSLGSFINFFLPFRLGTLFKAWYAGRKMKNGKSFSLATIIVDVVLDFFAVSIIFLILYFLKSKYIKSVIFYIATLLILIIGITVSIIFNKLVKIVIYKIASIFNQSIELKILKTSWFTIISFKDIIRRVKKSKLIIYTVLVWSLYLLSYYFLVESVKLIGYNTNLAELFTIFFSSKAIMSTTFQWILDVKIMGIWLMCIHMFVPILLVYGISFIYRSKHQKTKYYEILPQVNTNDRLAFLKQYFNSDNRDYLKKYIALNNDIAIIEDFSAGSNATTMLCSKDGKLFYRKYSFGKDAEKLHEQVQWINGHKKELTLTKIIKEYYEDGCCLYDMPYIQNTVTCFNYVHTMPIKTAWKTIKEALDDISKNLHTINVQASDRKTIDKYIDDKVIKNLDKIENGKYIRPLIKNKYIYINGKKYYNLEVIKNYLNKEYLEKIFEHDIYSDIHGDFTIENIICYKNNSDKGKNYYIIDPNTGNIHNSPNLDYAKLLQSIHGGYEFLMNTKNVSTTDNNINFLFTKSSTYCELFELLKQYLETKFDEETVRSIFFHEIIHWLRLLPYKIEKNNERSVLFYAGFIMVANDVIKWYGKK